METISTPDFVSKIVELNEKDLRHEDVELEGVDKALDEMAKLKANLNQEDEKSIREEDEKSSCEENMKNHTSTLEEENEMEDQDFKTPCPWQTGKEDYECSEVLNEEMIPFQTDGKLTQNKKAFTSSLEGRWSGTEFERVATACNKKMEWCDRGDDLCRDILEWLGNNKEARLVEEAAEMVDGLDTLWEKEETTLTRKLLKMLWKS